MRTYIIFSLIFALLFSCDSKQKYQGPWFGSYYSGNDFPEKLEIRNDSIHFNYPDFSYQNSYSLKIINNTFKFNNVSVSAKIYTDSLILNNYNVYTKSPYKDIPQDALENRIIIELPKLKLNNLSSFDYTNKGYVVSHVRYGIRHDNGEYSLQLNDKFSDFKDLAPFLAFEISSIRYEVMPSFKTLFFIDKNAKMIEIEKLFLVLSLINNLSIDFVNNISLKSSDSIGLFYQYETLNKKLLPFYENDKYYSNIFETPLPPPPPYFTLPTENDSLLIKYIFLRKNKIYYNNKTIKKAELTELIKKSIKGNHIIFSLYDLDSYYGNFLEMNAIINSAYLEIRKAKALSKFGESLDKLTREELTEIKNQTPMKHVWSYSFPHYQSMTKKNNSFYGLKVTPFDSLK